MPKAFTIKYTETYKSGHVAQRGMTQDGQTPEEALIAFSEYVNRHGIDAEFVSIEALSPSEQAMHDAFRNGSASTMGD